MLQPIIDPCHDGAKLAKGLSTCSKGRDPSKSRDTLFANLCGCCIPWSHVIYRWGQLPYVELASPYGSRGDVAIDLFGEGGGLLEGGWGAAI